MSQVDLLTFLLEQKVISSAQFSVAQADIAMSGLSAEDVVLARRWLDEEKLAQIAPWLKGLQAQPGKIEAGQTSPEDAAAHVIYQKNLKEYRRLVARAMGETN